METPSTYTAKPETPKLAFEQWRAIFKDWTPLRSGAREVDIQSQFSKLAHTMLTFSLISPEMDTYDELALAARYWLSTHYASDLHPRQDARRYWNLWKHAYGARLEKYMGADWFTDCCTRPGYIYVLKMGNWYKIGRTDDPMRRFPQISVKMPLPTRLWSLFYVEDMYEEEALLHEYYAPFRTNGEWFELPDKEVLYIHSWQPWNICHAYQRIEQPAWRKETLKQWKRYYADYLARVNSAYEQRTRQ